jgi:hypothetical protein
LPVLVLEDGPEERERLVWRNVRKYLGSKLRFISVLSRQHVVRDDELDPADPNCPPFVVVVPTTAWVTFRY